MSITVVNYSQGSPEWFHARIGRLTGSRAADMLATIKTGEAASRRNLRVQLVCERLTSIEQGPDFHSRSMQRGQEREADAIALFESVTGNVVRFAGFLAHDELMVGCSLDGYIGSDFEEILEVKVPKAAVHLEYLRRRTVPPKYIPQLRHNLWVSGAQRAHFASFGPDFPEPLQLHVVTLEREAIDVEGYAALAVMFLEEVEQELQAVLEMAREPLIPLPDIWSASTTQEGGKQ